MPKRIEYRELEPFERRVALMHVADASLGVIAQMLGMNTETVDNILKRPRVARFCLLLTGIVKDGLEPGIRDLNEAFKQKAERAFQLECAEMEALHDLGEDTDVKVSSRIRAKLGVTFTARDILDRAGHRAPTRVQHSGSINNLPPEAAEALTEAARELVSLRKRDDEIDITPSSAEGTAQIDNCLSPLEHANGNGNGSDSDS